MSNLPLNPVAGEGCIWDGTKWLKVAPTMEAWALISVRRTMDEALTLLERCRDQLLLKPEDRIKMGEVTKFCERVRNDLGIGSKEHR